MASERPYLSVVATARNDDHGGNLLRRMQIFVNGLIAQAKRYDLTTELVLVEWNPPDDKPSLEEAIQWPRQLGPVTIRSITVGPDIHGQLRFSKVLPLYQMLAKNVGIRRARGEFVLATNIDILFSDELFEFLAKRDLQQGTMYRIDRSDATSDVPPEASIEDQLKYCETHLIRINAREGSRRVTGDGRRILESDDIVPADSGISLGVGWSELQGGDVNYRLALAEATLLVDPQPEQSDLWLRLEMGLGATLPAPLRLSAWSDGEPLGVAEVTGPGWLCIPRAASSDRSQEVRLYADRGPEWDPRTPPYQVIECSWEPPQGEPEETSWGAPGPPQPTSPPALKMGPGWYGVEYSKQERFRWAASGCELLVGPSLIPEWSLRAELEPGPAVGFGAIHVQIRDDSDRVVSTAVVQGRRVATFSLSASPERAARYRLFAAFGDTPVEIDGDGRLMHLRLFSAEWAPQTARDPGEAQIQTAQAAVLHCAEKIFRLEPLEESASAQAQLQPPHTNGCGDFTLMARDDWFDLRGYPEFDLFSMHLDAVLCMSAHYGGIREDLLEPPKRIYHIEHAVGSGFTPEGNRKLQSRLAASGIKSLDWREVFEWERQMARFRSPMIFNRQNWGLASSSLPERIREDADQETQLQTRDGLGLA